MSGEVIIRKQLLKISASTEKLAFDCRQFANESFTDDLVKMYERIFYQSAPSNQYVIIDSLKVDLGMLSTHDFKNHLFELLEGKLINELRVQFEIASDGISFDETVGDEQEILKKTDPDLFTTEDEQYEGDANKTARNEKGILKKTNPVTYTTEDQHYHQALLLFLRSGTFPWWYQKTNNKTPAEILKGLSEKSRINFLTSLITKARTSAAELMIRMIKRLYIHLHHSAYETYLVEMTDLISEDRIKSNIRILIHQKDSLTGLFQISSKDFYEQAVIFILLSFDETDFIRKFLLHLNQTFAVSADELKKRLAELIDRKLLEAQDSLFNFERKESLLEADLHAELTPKKSTTLPELNEGIYISNAGLVILHPFLSTFFKGLNFINQNDLFSSAENQARAAVVLNYLQSGQVDYKEWEMPLNKILCGMAVDQLIPENIILSDEEKDESDLLLQSVIEYWEALKGASIEALQTTFFIREGKVMLKENNWLIQVERTGVDILLDRLPWGIGTIKLPWLKEIIYIEW